MFRTTISVGVFFCIVGCNEKNPDQYEETESRSLSDKSIEGTVSFGAAASFTQICGTPLDTGESVCTTTDENGRYEIEGLGNKALVMLRAQTDDQDLLGLYIEYDDGNTANVNEITTVVTTSTQSKLEQEKLITCNHGHIECLINQNDFDTSDIAGIAKDTADVVISNMDPFLGELWPADTSELMVDPYDLNPLNEGVDALQERVDFVYGTQERFDEDGHRLTVPVVDTINSTGSIIASAPLESLTTDNGFVGPDSLGQVNTVSDYEAIVSVASEGGFAEYQGGDNVETGEKKFYCTKPLYDSTNDTTKLEISCLDSAKKCGDTGGNVTDTAHIDEQACWSACYRNAGFSGGTWVIAGEAEITYGAAVCVDELSEITRFDGFSQLEACALNPEECQFGENISCETRYFGNNSTQRCKDEDDQLVKVTEYDFLGHVIASIVYTDPITRVTDAYHTTDDGRSTEIMAVESVEKFIFDEEQINSGIWRVVSGVFYDTDAQIIKRSEFDTLGAGSLTDYFVNDEEQSCVNTISFEDWDTVTETVEQCL